MKGLELSEKFYNEFGAPMIHSKFYEIENMIELEGADNSINPEVPELVKNYVAPEALSESLYDFTIDLEGVLYELPCPVSVFLENGFTINEKDSEMEIASGTSIYDTITKGREKERGKSRKN